MSYYTKLLEAQADTRNLPPREQRLFLKARATDELMVTISEKIEALKAEFIKTHGAHQMLVELLEEETYLPTERERLQLPIPEPMDFPEDEEK